MKEECFLLLIFTLCYSVQPIHVGWTTHALTEVVANDSADDRKYMVVSDNGIVVARNSVLSVQDSNGTLSEVSLSFRPDEIYAHNLTDTLHVVAAAHEEQSSINEVDYCTYSNLGQLSCNIFERYTPPTRFVVSLRIDEHDAVTVWAVYYYEGYLTYHNVIGGYEEYFLQLPENCTCISDCLAPVKEPNGRVMVRCDDGTVYLYELYSERFFVMPPEVEQVVTSNYRELTFVSKPAEELHQDIIVETNMVTDKQSAATLPLAGSLANSSNPVYVRDMCIVSVNRTNQSEVLYFLRNNSILYFELDELGIYPEIKYLPLPPTITQIAVKGSYESSIVIEGVYMNGSLVLLVIEACEQQRRNESVAEMDYNTTNINATPTSHNPISYTQSDPHSTEPPSPCTTAKPEPTSNVDNQASPDPTSCDSKFEPASFAYGIIAGFIPTAAIAVVVVIFLYRIMKSKGQASV